MYMKVISKAIIAGVFLLMTSACSLNDLSVRFSSMLIEHRVEALNRETDLAKARHLLSANIDQLESLLSYDKHNLNLHIYASQAYYSYAFAFVEDVNTSKAIELYFKSYLHAIEALKLQGVTTAELQGRSPLLRQKIHLLPESSVEALYWTALSWAKLIEMKQPDMLLFSQLPKVAMLMQQVFKRDSSYQLGGAYLFFAVYYGGRSRFLGGDDVLAGEYFEFARSLNKNRLLLVDYLQAKYLNGRVRGENARNRRLIRIIQAPEGLYPEQALMNAIAKHKAAQLLSVSQIEAKAYNYIDKSVVSGGK